MPLLLCRRRIRPEVRVAAIANDLWINAHLRSLEAATPSR